MRLYTADKLPTTPDQLTVDQWSQLSIDKQQRLNIGIVESFDAMFNEFQLHVWALENDHPSHPNGQRSVPEYIQNGSSYLIKYRGISYAPGFAPAQSRKPVELHLPPIFTTIQTSDLEDLLLRIYPVIDTTGFTTEDYYNHIIRDNGSGPEVRELLIDGRDLGY